MAKRGVGRGSGRRGAKRGRAQVALVLIGFFLVASSVIARRSAGAAKAQELLALDQTRATLDAERIKLVNDIRNATTLSRLGPVVSRRLGLHTPADSQVVRLPRPSPRTEPRP
jgi:hypothetical protein